MRNKKGISLIVLIITIIVVIILAAVVIITISKNNPIESAKEARFKEDVRTFQDELSLYISKQYANAGGHWEGNISAKKYDEIVEYIPSFTKKYEGKFVINNNILEYTNNLDDNEKEYAQSLNVKEQIKLLPDEYEQIEYIVFLANVEGVAINTGIKNNNISKVEIGAKADYSQYQMLIYSAEDNNTYRGSPYIYNTLNKSKMQGSGYDFCAVISSPLSENYIGKNIYVDFSIQITSSNTKNVFIGGASPGAWAGSERHIYYCRIYDVKGNLIRNYIPCYRKSDHRFGMFDLIEKAFYEPRLIQ